MVGYGFTCPVESCHSGVHMWSHASDCNGAYDLNQCKNANGQPGCWTWTGSPEDDTLTGSPSLHCPAERGGCGFHGYCVDGVLTSV